MDPVRFFLYVLRSALLSTGGMGNVPILHDDLVRTGFATDSQFAASMAVGQIAPGPSGLWVVTLGYFMGGWLAALLALVAVTLPPVIVLLIDKQFEKFKHHPAVIGFIRGLGITVVGVYVTVMVGLFNSSTANMLVALAVATVALWFALRGKVPVIAIIAAAGVLGLVVR